MLFRSYYPALTTHLTERGRELPEYVQREFEDYLKCGRLEHGFLRVRCESCHVEHLVAFSYRTRVFRCDGPVWRRFRGQLPFGAVNDALTSAGNSVYASYTYSSLVHIVTGRVGIFVGGTTEWKLSTLLDWGRFAATSGCWLHVGRVNTTRRIALCAAAGADSSDGSSAVQFPSTEGKLRRASTQADLYSPRYSHS